MSLKRVYARLRHAMATSGVSLTARNPHVATLMRATRLQSRSSCRQDRLLDRLRQRNRAKECFWIKVILAGFVDDPEQTVFLGHGVAKRNVDFPLLERDRVALVVDA